MNIRKDLFFQKSVVLHFIAGNGVVIDNCYKIPEWEVKKKVDRYTGFQSIKIWKDIFRNLTSLYPNENY